jgi:serine/threonine protein kinase/tetratricopeptide (TPR) repeat protein
MTEHLDENTLLGFLAASISEEGRSQVERHMDRCPECRALVSALAETSALLPLAEAPTAHDAQTSIALPPEWRVGAVVAGRFELEECVGAGGMGAVFRARDRTAGETVAVKAMLASHGDCDERFEREARVLSELSHPAIVRYVAHGATDGGQAYLAMEWLKGEDLEHRLERGPMSLANVVALTRRVAEGLAAAHVRGVVHRDVKPSNIFLPDGLPEKAMIIDFGIARATRQGSLATRTGSLLGTPGYIAPEQARGLGALDARADIFSLGCVLYECLTGQRAFVGSDLVEVLAKILLETPQPPSTARAEIPAALDRLVLAMLAKDAAKRPASCDAVVAELGSVERDLTSPRRNPVHAYFGSLARSVTSSANGAKRRATLAAAVLALMAGAGLLGARRFMARAPSPSPSSASLAERPFEMPIGPIAILVLGIENRTPDPIMDNTLDDVLSLALDRSKRINAVSGNALRSLAAELDAGPIDEGVGQKLAARDGEVVLTARGSVVPKGVGYELSVTVANVANGAVVASARRDAPDTSRVVATIVRLAGDVRAALGDPPPADPKLAELTSLSPSLEADHEVMTGRALVNAGKFPEAIAHYRRAEELDPSFAQLHMNFGRALANLGASKEASLHYRLALQYSDTMGDKERLKFMGDYFVNLGDYDRAVAAFEELLKLRPRNGTVENGLAVACAFQRDTRRAVEVERRASAEHPKHVILQSNLALLELFVGNFDVAARQAEKVIAEFPSPGWSTYQYLAVADVLRGDEKGAAAAYAKLEESDASAGSAALADRALAAGQPTKAATLLEHGLRLDEAAGNSGPSASKWALLAEARARRGDTAGALTAAKTATLSDDTATLYVAGEALVSARSLPKALAIAFGLVQQGVPGSVRYGKLLEGDALRAGGKLQEAVGSLEAARHIYDDWLVHYELGRVHLELGDYAAALTEFETCVARRGEGALHFGDDIPTTRYLPSVTYFLARAREGLRSPDARATYDAFLALMPDADHDALTDDARRRRDRLPVEALEAER